MSKSSTKEFTVHLKSGTFVNITAESFNAGGDEVEFYSEGNEKIPDLYIPKDGVLAIVPKRVVEPQEAARNVSEPGAIVRRETPSDSPAE